MERRARADTRRGARARSHSSCCLLLALLLTAPGGATRNERTVQTAGGAVRGAVRTDDRGQPYHSFRGIPYAQPPIGPLRFESPRPAAAWDGVLEAQREGPACPQHDVLYGRLMRPRGFSEACLTLNVHVPFDAPAAAAVGSPVLVFIHGGGFGFGSGDADVHGPEYLVAKGIIVVTFNYRLGALGFLSLDSEQLPDNVGLRDMLLALQWVKLNIAAFGGDPHKVTLGGQSAGAAAAHLLALSPAATGLFARCIVMSGIAMRSWFSTSRSNAKRVADILLSKLNITETDDARAVRKLRRLPVEQIIRATSDMQETEGMTVFGPVVERRRGDSDRVVVAEDPYAATVSGRLADVPILIGHTDAECHTFARRFRELNFGLVLKVIPKMAIPQSLLFASSETLNAQHASDIGRLYFKNDTIDPEEVLEDYLRYCTDANFAYPTLELAQAASRGNSAPVYVYEFAYDGHYSPIKAVVSGGFRGAGHIEDMTYLLRTNSYPANISDRIEDEWAKEIMTSLFSNFIKTGSPSPASLGSGLVEWPAYEVGAEFSLRLGRNLRIRQHAHAHLLPFFRYLHSDTHNDTRADIPKIGLSTAQIKQTNHST